MAGRTQTSAARVARRRAAVEAAETPADHLLAAVAYLRAVVDTQDPALGAIALDKAAQGVISLAELVNACAAVGYQGVAGVRDLPPKLEDPRRPGWLCPEARQLRRRQWNKSKTRRELWARVRAGEFSCGICSLPGDDGQPVIDHIIPIARGGTNDPLNLQVLCSACNGRKGALL